MSAAAATTAPLPNGTPAPGGQNNASAAPAAASQSQSQSQPATQPSAAASQPPATTTAAGPSTAVATAAPNPNVLSTAAAAAAPASSAASNPRPRDARTIELLLTAQGVTAFEQRVPLLLLDFAYRHTSAVLSDALHLSADPYTSHAGARPSASSGAAPVNVGDATITSNAVQLAIASRLNFQFRGGSGGGSGGGVSKEWMMEMAREKNKVALPKVSANEWGVRLPSERFVLNGISWGLKGDGWIAGGDDETSGDEDDEGDSDEDMEDAMGIGNKKGGENGDAMEGIEKEDIGGDGVEGGTVDDLFGEDGDDNEEMEDVDMF
ncbi:transcription initiation factor IID, 31kD subunit-domain-containing protein [Pseudoneurospora amorphoporcata]|uniref:Transcription initiation factor IID, 31kD subunit-domain-containing protein n=1 Tax=Pseudoneurospora amorphoporcata TaxID=241081 RepID=A0AAN6NX49_9PEZI|nr:transcription initiation factor IID, 31kD subunit-domain-containing protein [Pseudoneurospora amorphoporcata]